MFTEYFVTIKVYSYTHTIWSSIIVNSLIPTKRKRKKIRPKSNHGRYAEWLSGVPPPPIQACRGCPHFSGVALAISQSGEPLPIVFREQGHFPNP
jgi:hypothetical protein